MSLTWDEPSFIASGFSYITTQNFSFNPSHAPLMKSLEALPLLFMDINPTLPNIRELTSQINPQAEYGVRFVYYSGNDPHKIALWCRLPVMVLGTGLILAIFLWGRELYGNLPALLGATLAAFCPNLIAQSKVATEDIGCTTFMLLSVWAYWHWLRRPSMKQACLTGLVTGLALLAKYTSLLLLPIYLILFIKHIFFDRKDLDLKSYLPESVILMTTALFVVSIAYNFHPYYYLEGITHIYSDIKPSPNWYFLGEISKEPRWYYYIVAFIMKTPVATLSVIVLAAFLAIYDKRYQDHLFVLLLPVLVIVGVCCFDRYNFGVRRILPALPFLYLFAARVLVADRKMPKLISVLAVTGLVAELFFIYPHHLSFFNFATGGPGCAPYLLTADDSDTGQDLPALAEWQRQHPEAGTIKLVYNGSALPQAYGVNATEIPFTELDNPTGGTYAVSITELVFTPWFRSVQPTARAGYSIYIYQF